MPRRLARVLVAVCAWWVAAGAAGCEALKPLDVANDLVAVVDGGTTDAGDAGTLEDALRDAVEECRRALIDAGRLGGGPPQFDYCSIAPFYDGCPLRVLSVCAEQTARKLEPRCPPRDAGVESPDSKLCDAVVWPLLPSQP